ncbi:MAG: hypothetical protein RJA31_628 [Actinomycetota bacterium]
MIAPAFLLGLIGDTRIDVAGELLARVTNVLDHLGSCGVGVAPTNRFEKCRVVVNGRLGPPRNGRVKTTRRVTRHKSDDLRESRCRCSEIDFAVELVVEFFKRSEIASTGGVNQFAMDSIQRLDGGGLCVGRCARGQLASDHRLDQKHVTNVITVKLGDSESAARGKVEEAFSAKSLECFTGRGGRNTEFIGDRFGAHRCTGSESSRGDLVAKIRGRNITELQANGTKVGVHDVRSSSNRGASLGRACIIHNMRIPARGRGIGLLPASHRVTYIMYL